jgi:hypothetical protein
MTPSGCAARALAGVASAVLLLGAPPPVAAQAESATRYGVHMDLTWNGSAPARRPAVGLAASELHAEVSRNSLLWHHIESIEGSMDWARTDSVVEELTAAGIEPLFTVYGSPPWANGTPETTPLHYLYVPVTDRAFETWLDRYGQFLRAAVRRYRGSVSRWELWNEPNLQSFWKPGPDLERYVSFHDAMRAVILAEDPQAQVAIGGLGALNASGAASITGFRFLEGLLSRGLQPHYVAIHPYSSSGQSPDAHIRNQNNFDDIQMVRDLLVSRGLPVPLWATEWGWDTREVTEAAQAAYVGTSLELIRTRYRFVEVATYFVDRDRPGRFHDGLFDAAWRPKPAAFGFAAFMRRVRGLAPPTPISPAPSTPPVAAVSVAVSARVQAPGPKEVKRAGATTQPRRPARVIRLTVRGRARRITATARYIGCPRCRPWLSVRTGHRWRHTRMRAVHRGRRPASGPVRVAGALSLPGPGRWLYRMTLRDPRTGRVRGSSSGTIRVR